MPDPIVTQLQTDCLDASVPISTLLRKAKLIAAKLSLGNTEGWLNSELNGYSCPLNDLPLYRKGAGQAKFFNPYHGWLDIVLSDSKSRDIVSSVYLTQAIAEIEHLSNSDREFVILGFLPPINDFLHETLQIEFNCGLHVSKSVLVGALEGVKNTTLEWAIQLEAKGILGEGLSFSLGEKERAQLVTNHIYGGNIGVLGNVGGDVNNSHFVNSGKVDIEAVRRFLDQATPALGGLDVDTRAIAEPLLSDLRKEVEGKAEPGRVRSLMNDLKNVLVGASGNIVASAILSALTGSHC